MAGIFILTGGDRSTALAAYADDMKRELQDLSEILTEVNEEIIQPRFGRNYDSSGLKPGKGLLKTALTKTGARGNYLTIRPDGLTAGVDYSAEPHFKFVIEGRGDVTPKQKKALRWDDNGRVIFSKRSQGTPPHDLVSLSDADFEKIAASLTEKLVARGACRLPK